MAAAGIAMMKLKAMAEALSLKPSLFTCPKKYFTTSCKHSWRKPGILSVLLFLIKKATGLSLAIKFSNFVNAVLFYLYYPAVSFQLNRLKSFDKFLHTYHALQNYW